MVAAVRRPRRHLRQRWRRQQQRQPVAHPTSQAAGKVAEAIHAASVVVAGVTARPQRAEAKVVLGLKGVARRVAMGATRFARTDAAKHVEMGGAMRGVQIALKTASPPSSLMS